MSDAAIAHDVIPDLLAESAAALRIKHALIRDRPVYKTLEAAGEESYW